jgi:hypothetical protein
MNRDDVAVADIRAPRADLTDALARLELGILTFNLIPGQPADYDSSDTFLNSFLNAEGTITINV